MVPGPQGADVEILARLAEKEYLTAFEALLAGYKDKVYRLCYAILGDRGMAEETAQDVFVRIWKALPAYRGEASLSTWIFAISRNTSLTASKRRPQGRVISLELPGVRMAVEQQQAEADVDRHTIDVEQLIGELPGKYRAVVRLYFLEDKSYEEAARMLDLPMGTVKTYLHRARKVLAGMLENQRRSVPNAIC